MKSRDFFLIFIFGLFIFLLPNFVEAACLISCMYCEDSGDCQWGYTYNCVEKLGIIGSVGLGTDQICSSGWKDPSCPSGFSCSDSGGKCKNQAFPTGSNGQSCTARDRYLSGLSCYDCTTSGYWDYSESQCVKCDGYKEKITDGVIGNTSQMYWDACNDANNADGDGQCESACGAEAACDEIAVNASCGTGKKCNSSCQCVAEECNSCTVQNISCPSSVNTGQSFNISFQYYGTGPTGYPYEHRSLWRGTTRIDCKYGNATECSWHSDSFSTTAPTTPGTYTYYVKCYGASSQSTTYCDSADSSQSCDVKVCECTSTTIGGCCDGCNYCPAGKVFNGTSCVDATADVKCAATVNKCTDGSCSGEKRYPECQAGGVCDSSATSYYTSETVYASASKVFTATCTDQDATSASLACDANTNYWCTEGSCSGYYRYSECNGAGTCDGAATTYYQQYNVVASTGYTLTSTCGTTGTTLCGYSSWNKCGGVGSPYSCQKGRDQLRCDAAQACTYDVGDDWANVTAGYVCSGGSEIAGSATYYCGLSAYNGCSADLCDKKRDYLACNGANVCNYGDYGDSFTYVTASKVCSAGSEIDATASVNTGVGNFCTAGACSGEKRYYECDGSGAPATAYYTPATVYASASKVFTATCTDQDANSQALACDGDTNYWCTAGNCSGYYRYSECNAGGTCDTAATTNYHQIDVTASAGKVLSSSCTDQDATSTVKCAATVNSCTANSCSGQKKYPECQAGGVCDSSATTYYTSESVLANDGYVLKADCSQAALSCTDYCGPAGNYCTEDRQKGEFRQACGGTGSCNGGTVGCNNIQDCGATSNTCSSKCQKDYTYTCSAGSCGTYHTYTNASQDYRCEGGNLINTGSCATSTYNGRSADKCDKKRDLYRCDGEGGADANCIFDVGDEWAYVSAYKIANSSGQEVDASSADNTGTCHSCTEGSCSGTLKWSECDGSGNPGPCATYNQTETVYPSAGYTLTSTCGTTGTTLCDYSTWNGCNGSCQKKRDQLRCDASHNCAYDVGDDYAYLSTSGKVCSAGSEVAPSSSINCDKTINCVDNSCSAERFYRGCVAGATSCTETGKVSYTAWPAPPNYTISETTYKVGDTCATNQDICGYSTYNKCGGTGSPYSCQKGRDQYRCNGTGSCTQDVGDKWLNVAAGYVCSAGSEIAASTIYYCGFSAYNGRSADKCDKKKDYSACNGSNVCNYGDYGDAYDYVSAYKIANSSGQEVDASSADNTGNCHSCTEGSCSGTLKWSECDGSGNPGPCATYNQTETVYPSAGYTLTSTCGTTGTTNCDTNFCWDGAGHHEKCDRRCNTSHVCDYYNCVNHCTNTIQDCDETGFNCGGSCPSCDTTPPTTTIKVKRKSTGEDLTAAGSWLRADTYTIQFEDKDQADGSGSNCENCSCEYSIYSCDVGGTNCNTVVISLTSRTPNSSFDILAGKTAPTYNLEGAGRYRIYSGAKDMANYLATEYRYINFDFTPPRTEIR